MLKIASNTPLPRLKKPIMPSRNIGIVFALMIWFSWPYSSITFIGVLLGVHLLLSGVAKLMYKA